MRKYLGYENIYFRNILFFLLIFGFLILSNRFVPEIPSYPVSTDAEILAETAFLYLLIFAHNHFSVRLLLLKKRYIYFTIACLVFAIIFTYYTQYVGKMLGETPPVMIDFLMSFFPILIGTAIYFLHIWILENFLKTKLRLFNKEAELDFLKQQLSPHFLFNSLNNLYGIALDAPKMIPEKILELSDLLRYQVESTNKTTIKVTEEMDFVQNYLNYIGFKTNNLSIKNITKGLKADLYLPPLLFLPMIENAIKYSSETDPAYINLLWNFESKYFSFSIQNSYLQSGSKIIGTKIGLENLAKRLGILNLKHELNIDKDKAGNYKIELKLWGLSTNA